MDQFVATQKSSKNWKVDSEDRGWNAIKILWGVCGMICRTRPEGALAKKLQELVEDEQRIFTSDAATFRNELFNTPQLKAMVSHLSDEDLEALAANLGGHDIVKINAACPAEACTDKPTIILARTIKGYGLAQHLQVEIQPTARRKPM